MVPSMSAIKGVGCTRLRNYCPHGEGGGITIHCLLELLFGLTSEYHPKRSGAGFPTVLDRRTTSGIVQQKQKQQLVHVWRSIWDKNSIRS